MDPEEQVIGQNIDQEELQKMQAEANDYLTAAYQDFKHRLCNDYLILNQKQQADGGKFEFMRQYLNMIPGNSSAFEIDIVKNCCCIFGFLVVPAIYLKTRSIFEVEANKFAFVVFKSDKGEKTVIYGPGYHILGYNYRLEGIYSFDQDVNNNIIQSSVGDLKIAKVEQGFIMCMEHQGQNILLGPGIHLITEPMSFVQYKSLEESYFINLGPEKWITIPSGYDGISLNKGKLQILEGGKQHYLSHMAERFLKIVPKTYQSDKIPTDIPSYVHQLTAVDRAAINRNKQQQQQNQQRFGKKGKMQNQNIQSALAQDDGIGLQRTNPTDPTQILFTTTAEGSTVALDTMIQWQIIDTKLAALTAMEILKIGQIGNEQNDGDEAITASNTNISNLRLTVLRIAKNHLTCRVGSINLAGEQALGYAINIKKKDKKTGNEEKKPLLKEKGGNTNFDILESLQGQTAALVDLINEDLAAIGCKCESIAIYKVTPSRDIQSELDKQTKARVDSNTAKIKADSKLKSTVIDMEVYERNNITEANSKASTIKVKAKTYADQKITRANGEAKAIRSMAEARKEEAQQLNEFKVAKHLAIQRAAGEVGQKLISKNSNNVIYGTNPAEVVTGILNSIVQNSKIQ